MCRIVIIVSVAYKFEIVLTRFGNLVTGVEKKIIIQGILEASFNVLKKKINTRTRKSRAKTWSKQHNHSGTTQVAKSIFFNVLMSKQKLPARKRDFIMNIPGAEKVWQTQLTRGLTKNVRLLLLKNSKNKFPFGIGRQKPYLSEERRGKPSYYTESKVKGMIDEILDDPLVIESLTNSLLSSGIFFEYLKVAFVDVFNQIKEDKYAFFDTYAPFRISEKQLALNKEKLPNSSLPIVEKMTANDIEHRAEQFATRTVRQFTQSKEMSAVFFGIMGLLFFGDPIRK